MLRTALQEEWIRISQEMVDNLILSIRRHNITYITVRGDHIPFRKLQFFSLQQIISYFLNKCLLHTVYLFVYCFFTVFFMFSALSFSTTLQTAPYWLSTLPCKFKGKTSLHNVWTSVFFKIAENETNSNYTFMFSIL